MGVHGQLGSRVNFPLITVHDALFSILGAMTNTQQKQIKGKKAGSFDDQAHPEAMEPLC